VSGQGREERSDVLCGRIQMRKLFCQLGWPSSLQCKGREGYSRVGAGVKCELDLSGFSSSGGNGGSSPSLLFLLGAHADKRVSPQGVGREWPNGDD
jgi:hypothetical protein